MASPLRGQRMSEVTKPIAEGERPGIVRETLDRG
jgi:hypothetical protein